MKVMTQFQRPLYDSGEEARSYSFRFSTDDPDTPEAVLARVELLSRIMDSAFTIPGTNMRMGADAILGLVPVIGDLISTAISSYIVWEAKRQGVSKLTLARMVGNMAIDTTIGAIPFIGDAFDIAFKANRRNLALLKRHLDKMPKGPRDPRIIEGTAMRMEVR